MLALLESRRESLKDENETLCAHNRALRSYLTLTSSPLDVAADCASTMGGGMGGTMSCGSVAAGIHGMGGGGCHGCGSFSTPGSRGHSQPGTRPATPCQIAGASMAAMPQQPQLPPQQLQAQAQAQAQAEAQAQAQQQ